MSYALINGEKNIVTGKLGIPQKLAILSAFQSSPFRRLSLMLGKAVPEIQRQAFVQQNLHAILANSDSLASSRA